MEEYDESDLQIIDDAVALVRRLKRLFIGDDVIPENLATNIANDALTLGVAKVEVHHHGDWWVVCASEDWLALGHSYRALGDRYNYPVKELFRRLVPLEGGGVNSSRREILLTAFAEDVFTKKDKELLWITGGSEQCEDELESYFESIPDDYRVVGFRLTPAPPALA